VRRDNQQEMSFAFVESEFVQAIREGWWVLLDNINSAPPEVLERLNSLSEDNPMLSLYENSDGQVLTRKEGIHPNFRLFTTANLNRIYSNKLSSAFLNRVIRIWLPPMDDCQLTAEKDVTHSDLYELLVTQRSPIAAGKQLAHLLVLIHINVKQHVKDGQLIQSKQFLVNHEDDPRLDLLPLLAELIKTREIATRFDRTPSVDLSTFVQDFLQTGSRSFQILCDQLSNELDTFIRNTSFSDTAKRLAFPQRAVSVVDTFQRFFSSSLFATFDH
jgi:hypothetical protein